MLKMKKIKFVKSMWNDDSQAPCRIFSTPIYSALIQEFSASQYLIDYDLSEEIIEQILITDVDIIMFHFYDISAARVACNNANNASLICLICDIYNYELIRKIDELNVIFVVPTQLHFKVLKSLVNNPVVVVPEAVDPISLSENVLDLVGSNNFCWFGYPENFYKSLNPIIQNLILNNKFEKDKFGIISRSGETLLDGVNHYAFSHKDFYTISRNFDFTILSHLNLVEMNLNTYCKSPNKLITSIVRGFCPFFSNTPNYSEIAFKYGLSHLMFDNSKSLSDLLNNRDTIKELTLSNLAEARRSLLINNSPRMISEIFICEAIR